MTILSTTTSKIKEKAKAKERKTMVAKAKTKVRERTIDHAPSAKKAKAKEKGHHHNPSGSYELKMETEYANSISEDLTYAATVTTAHTPTPQPASTGKLEHVQKGKSVSFLTMTMLRYIKENKETSLQAKQVPPAQRNVLSQTQRQNIEQKRTRTVSKEMEPLLERETSVALKG